MFRCLESNLSSLPTVSVSKQASARVRGMTPLFKAEMRKGGKFIQSPPPPISLREKFRSRIFEELPVPNLPGIQHSGGLEITPLTKGLQLLAQPETTDKTAGLSPTQPPDHHRRPQASFAIRHPI